MSASSLILAHRYGYRPRSASSLAMDVFGQDDDEPEVDFQEVELEELEELDEEPLFQGPRNAFDVSQGLKAIALSLSQRIVSMVPYPVTYDVRMGQDLVGNTYAQVVFRCYDPMNLLSQASSWLLQNVGSLGVTVSTLPTTSSNEVVIVFAKGPVPVPAQRGSRP